MLISDRVLIVGVNSKIGGGLYKSYVSEGFSVLGTSRRRSEVKDNIFYLDVVSSQYDREKLPEVSVVFLCAYVSNMAECNANSNSKMINVRGILNLANYFLNKGSFVVFLSSNAVFNREQNYASETDYPRPETVYGQQKYDVENQLLGLATKDFSKNLAIVRMTKVLTHDLPLLKNWQIKILRGEKIDAFKDLKICPISLNYVVDCLRKIADAKSTGIFHLSGDAEYSYLEIGKRFSEISGRQSGSVIAREAGTSNPSMKASISMSMNATKSILGISPENSQTVIDDVLNFLKVKIY